MLIFVLLASSIIWIPGIIYLRTLEKALLRCSTETRTMSPTLVWLTLVPFVGLMWQYYVVINVAKSLGKEYKNRGLTVDNNAGLGSGLVMCTLGIITPVFSALREVDSFYAIITLVSAIIALISWGVYWVKISGFSAKLELLNIALPADIAIQLRVVSKNSGLKPEDFVLASLKEKLVKYELTNH